MTRRSLSLAVVWASLCQSACSGTLLLTSDPSGLEVYAGKELIGRTPLTVDFGEVDAARIDSGAYVLRLEKAGYQKISLIVPTVRRDMQLDIKLQSLLSASDRLARHDEPDAAMQRRYSVDSAALLEQQARVLRGEPPDTKVLDRIKAGYPDSGAPFLLDGLSHVVNARRGEAEKAFSEALNRDPWDDDAHAMLRRVQASPKADVGEAPTPAAEGPKP
jgi:hypothetical protein